MLSSFHIGNWKSFSESALRIRPLTVLVGANASGKTNALESVQLLSWLASGRGLPDIFSAIRDEELQLRGTPPQLSNDEFGLVSLGCTIEGVGGQPSLEFSIRLYFDGAAGPRVHSERLVAEGTNVPLYDAQQIEGDEYAIEIAYNNFARGGVKPRIYGNCLRPVFTQLTSEAAFGARHKESRRQIPQATSRLARHLTNTLALDPAPRRMRGYSHRLDNELRSDGANLSAVLAGLDKEARERALGFVRALPEQDVAAIGFVETPRGEVMVKLEESFGGKRRWRDAAVLSDGTLRILAIAGALLSVPEGSLVIIEEVDNGIHPPRVRALLRLLQTEAKRRSLRVLVTTHNPALLDAIEDADLGDVQLCYRDQETGDSRIVALRDLNRFASLVAQGPLGHLITQGVVERWIGQSRDQPAHDAWLDALRSAQ